jgi:hypothetical protein
MASAWAAMLGYVPKVDGLIARTVEGTGVLDGGSLDFMLAAMIGLAFPMLRYILDRTVYDVGADKTTDLQTCRVRNARVSGLSQLPI